MLCECGSARDDERTRGGGVRAALAGGLDRFAPRDGARQATTHAPPAHVVLANGHELHLDPVGPLRRHMAALADHATAPACLRALLREDGLGPH